MRARWNKPGALWGYRPGTLLFYGVLTLLSITVILFLIITGSRPRRTALETGARLEVLLDAGHGGDDGGCSAAGWCSAAWCCSAASRASENQRCFCRSVMRSDRAKKFYMSPVRNRRDSSSFGQSGSV